MTGGDAALVVATDLDGCLLDETTYDWRPASEALEALRRRRVTLVLASSKTRAEMEPLARELGATGPLIVENGGAVVFPGGAGERAVRVLGVARGGLVRALRELAEAAGIPVRGFAEMDVGEVARRTGLPPERAEAARRREYDEPFVVEGEGREVERLARRAEARGLRVTRGGRFFHLTGATDKGRALREALAGLGLPEGIRCVALGDSANDLALLRAAHRPIVVPRPGGEPDPALREALPEAERAPGPGPAGWNEAVLAVLAGRSLPRLGAPR